MRAMPPVSRRVAFAEEDRAFIDRSRSPAIGQSRSAAAAASNDAIISNGHAAKYVLAGRSSGDAAKSSSGGGDNEDFGTYYELPLKQSVMNNISVEGTFIYLFIMCYFFHPRLSVQILGWLV